MDQKVIFSQKEKYLQRLWNISVLEEMKHKTNEKDFDKFEWTFTGRDFKEASRKARLNTAPGLSGLSMEKIQAIITYFF